MKKIDLHIHTKCTISDAQDFQFDENVLLKYVKEKQIDAIAITNHNLFDLEQYEHLKALLKDITVFPGIEINIGENSSGHLIVISDPQDSYDFSIKCEKITEKIHNSNDFIELEDLINIYEDLSKYLLIPHTGKKPYVDKNIIHKLKNYLYCGEVASVKKFIYCINDDESLTPVIFSDFRPMINKELPLKQTYIDVDKITLNSIKQSLMDKSKVGISPNGGHDIFEALPGLNISTGLNIVIGARSSGKTHTLDALYEKYPNSKYIKQFSLLEQDSDKADKDFNKKLAVKQSEITHKYFDLFRDVVGDVKLISLEDDENSIDEYLQSLKEHAEETNRADSFSRCKLYAESQYSISNLNSLKSVISSVEILLDAQAYKDIIEKYISRDNLIELHKNLIQEYEVEMQIILKKKWVNNILNNIQSALQQKSAQTNVLKCDFYQIAKDRMKIKKFTQIVTQIQKPKVIYENSVGGFTTQIRKKAFNGAKELKAQTKSKASFSEAFKCYSIPYEYLKELKKIPTLEDSEYYLCFAKIEHLLLNEYGFSVSGGERAEYNLIQELSDAKQYEMLLVDEPESSFDNIFLKNKVNRVIKDLAKMMPVLIVTHNNTVGASIMPDYILYTVRKITDGKAEYHIYSGKPEQKMLYDVNGDSVKNIQATLDCLEAGEQAYLERRKEYEVLRNL